MHPPSITTTIGIASRFMDPSKSNIRAAAPGEPGVRQGERFTPGRLGIDFIAAAAICSWLIVPVIA